MAVNGVALGALAAGSVFTYAGIKGFSIPEALQAILQGRNPATLDNRYPVDPPVDLPSGGNTAVGASSATGQAIANKALSYAGQGYVWGGRADRPGDWDCSSFVSYVLGHDFGMTLPGGHRYGDPGYPPHSHGPVTTDFYRLGTQVPRSQVQAGDLLIWHPHCGIAISSTTMVSARSQRTGTGTSSIDGDTRYFGYEPRCQRVA